MAELEWKPARVPAKVPLHGTTVVLEPVDPGRHAAALFSSSADAPELWKYLAYGPFANQDEFTGRLRDRASSDDPMFCAVVDHAAKEARGMASYLRIEPEHGVIEIGHIWLAPAMQRTRQATESIFLLARHAFDDLGYRRLEWKCNSLNVPSRRAAERFGFVYEGTFRQHMVVKGNNRDTAWYAMTDGDWPIRRSAFEAWLEPENFDREGRQRRSLAEYRPGSVHKGD